MTLKAPIKPGHMVPNSMEIYIAKRWSDNLMQVGFYKDQSLAFGGENSDDVYSNWTLKKIRDWNKMTVSFSAHELTNEKLEVLQLWLTEYTAWTVASEVQVANPGEWSFTKDILLKYSNQDWTPCTIASVKALIDWTETTLVADTDYTVSATSTGSTAIKLLQTNATLTETAPASVKITITYSSTAADIVNVSHGENVVAEPFVMVLVNTFKYWNSTKSIKTYLENCYANKAVEAPIADSDNTTMWFPVEITGSIAKQEKIGFKMSEE